MNEDMYDVAVPYQDPFVVQARPVNIVPIANGYLVSGYPVGTHEYQQWYCIDHQEIAEKLARFI